MSVSFRALVSLFVLLIAAPMSSDSMMMKPAEYQLFLNAFELRISKLQDEVQSLNRTGVPVEKRLYVESQEAYGIQLLKRASEKIELERQGPELSRQIYMHSDVAATSLDLRNALGNLPTAKQEDPLSLLMEIEQMNERFFLHIIAEADDYRARLDDCNAARSNQRK